MPWKNGGGETREMMVSPPGATLDSLDWRVSLATVATDGPFSAFHGVQRTLCVIRGAGIRLQISDAAPITLLASSAPHSFNGEATTSATLIDGAIVDLNVMSRRGRWSHTVKRLICDGDQQLEVRFRPTLVFCQQGQLLCAAGQESNYLANEDCAVVDDDVPFISLRATEPAEVLVIELSDHPGG